MHWAPRILSLFLAVLPSAVQKPEVNAEEDLFQPDDPPILNDIPDFSNYSTPRNVTRLYEWDSYCDAETYGRNLDIDSCQQAFKAMSIAPRKATYRKRTDPNRSTYKLPIMTVSDSGLCVIEPTLKPGAAFAVASDMHAAAAARHTIDDCTVGGSLSGGVGYNIGGDNNLIVIVRSFPAKNVLCTGGWSKDGPEYGSCNQMLRDMNTDHRNLAFGNKAKDPSVDLELPNTVESFDGKCAFSLRSDTTKEIATWFELWRAAYVANELCVKRGQKAAVVGLGRGGNLKLSLLKGSRFTAVKNGS